MTNLRPGELRGILQSIYDDKKTLTPEIVLHEASHVDHPLHHRFTWDDKEAARKQRLSEAAELIRSVRVSYATRPDGSEKTVRAFVTPRGPGIPTGTYQPVDEVLANPIQRAILVRDAKREFETFRRRYEHLEEYGAIIAGTADADAG